MRVKHLPILLALLASVGHPPALADQTIFDVVSVKPVRTLRIPRAGAANLSVRPNGVRAAGITAERLIAIAYPTAGGQRRPARIAGGPDWLRTEPYEFIATTAAEMRSSEVTERVPALVRNVLEERFRLRGHLEMRPMPIFALTRAHRGDRLGPLLRRSNPRAEPWSGSASDYISAINMTTAQLAGQLTAMNAAGRDVFDRTGLPGGFDVDLYWSPQRTAATGAVPPEVDGPSLFTAVVEQLGLKLEAKTEPQDVFVVDDIQRPGEN